MNHKYSNKERAILAKVIAESNKLGDTIADVSLLAKFVSEQIGEWEENIVVTFLNVVLWNYMKRTGTDIVQIAEDVLHSAKKMKEEWD